ncbi:MAG: DUF2063 domain-containing protein [Alphaproteobacteria bacterium]|nr:MAG: DUF2063 domain-containing protein [Alphaproteobacteria bacterium]
MPALENEQGEFARAILAPPERAPRVLPRLAARPGVDPRTRVNVYRNNTYASLTATLLAVFPVTSRLVDERFLRFAAHRFIASFPPAEPRLSRFGADFPAFLRRFGQLAAVPFVAEVARLEWQIAVALDRPAAPPLPLASLTWLDAPDQAAFSLQPSLRLMVSRWPVFSVWTAHQAEAEPDLAFVRPGRGERLALWRAGASIRLIRLDAARFAFLRSLGAGAPLERAAARALARDRLFDLAAALAQLFGDGLVAGISRTPTPEN